MSEIRIRGLCPLKGEIAIQGSKNAALPMMAASVLHKGTTVLTHVPRIQDVFCMMGILESMGCRCRLEGHQLEIDAADLTSVSIPEHYIKAMRSSIILLGPLLGRFGEAVTSYPGGCSIGRRPIDLHLEALRRLGAGIREEDGKILASAGRLVGAGIRFGFPSVGATENALMAAVLAEGTTVIRGAAREPEIQELSRMLNGMGARIRGAGTDVIQVEGVKMLRDTQVRVSGDRIAAGTYIACVMAAGGRICLRQTEPESMTAVLSAFSRMGARIQAGRETVTASMDGRPAAIDLRTSPYPGFPTDLQSPALAVLASGRGTSCLEETVFEGRFATARELVKMGARIRVEGNRAMVEGRFPLTGTRVEAPDLRGGAALAAAAMAAEGETVIGQCRHIFRGYEDICRDLAALGASIQRESEATWVE